jgi:hypothetical protein
MGSSSRAVALFVESHRRIRRPIDEVGPAISKDSSRTFLSGVEATAQAMTKMACLFIQSPAKQVAGKKRINALHKPGFRVVHFWVSLKTKENSSKFCHEQFRTQLPRTRQVLRARCRRPRLSWRI